MKSSGHNFTASQELKQLQSGLYELYCNYSFVKLHFLDHLYELEII